MVSLKPSPIITGFILEAQGIVLNSSRPLLSIPAPPPHPAHPPDHRKHTDPLLSYCALSTGLQGMSPYSGKRTILAQGVFAPALLVSILRGFSTYVDGPANTPASQLPSSIYLFSHPISATHFQKHILDSDMINNSTLSKISVAKNIPLSNYIFPSFHLILSIIRSPS